MSSIWKRTLFVTFLIIVGLVFSEMVLQILFRLKSGPIENNAISIFAPVNPRERGTVWDIKRNYYQRWSTKEFSVDIFTDANGLRVKDKNTAVNMSDLQLVFLGDSFTFGHGVEYSDSYTYLASRAVGLKGETLSYKDGFQPEHYEFFFQEHPDLRPRIAVVGLFLGNDLDSDIAETDIQRSADGTIQSIALPGRKITSQGGLGVNASVCAPAFRISCSASGRIRLFSVGLNILNRSGRFRRMIFRDNMIPNTLNPESLELGNGNEHSARAFRSLVRLNQLVADRGGRLVVLIITQNYFHGPTANPFILAALQPRLAEILRGPNMLTMTQAFCRGNKLNCVDMVGTLQPEDFFAMDAHWNRTGHRKVGERLGAYLKETVKN